VSCDLHELERRTSSGGRGKDIASTSLRRGSFSYLQFSVSQCLTEQWVAAQTWLWESTQAGSPTAPAESNSRKDASWPKATATLPQESDSISPPASLVCAWFVSLCGQRATINYLVRGL
jgi:hypothetical protein